MKLSYALLAIAAATETTVASVETTAAATTAAAAETTAAAAAETTAATAAETTAENTKNEKKGFNREGHNRYRKAAQIHRSKKRKRGIGKPGKSDNEST